ncbi:MAG: efflux RND transporter permease subunit [Gemmataceae bacterium]|nr:efflux RND transporter permease subunit [Gemmataceae bacterium]
MLNLASKARPVFGAVVITVGLLTAAGIYSVTRMPSSIYPEVTFPRVAVVAKVPGLDLVTTELQVTRPLELQASSVLGVRRVRSTTIRGGCDLSIDFAPDTDMVNALHLASERLARAQLPPGVELTVEQMTPSVFPILSVVLTGGDSPSQLRDYAFYELAPQIKTIPDVLYANVAGGDLREIEVVVRPDSLLAADLSAADLADQIGRAHRLQPVGRIEGSPLAFQILVNTQGQTTLQIEDLIVSTKNGQPLRVRDVADVKVLHQDRVQSVGFEGRDAVVVTIFRQLRGNTVNVSRDVRDLLRRQPPPRNIRATVVYDQADFVNTAVDNVRDAILIGSVFSILILLAFLRSWRATLISALAIPTTLAITFLILHWVGATLNLMSLGGLAVAIGLIIDDTVVVIENIARHLTTGHGPVTAPPLSSGTTAVWYKPWTWLRRRRPAAARPPSYSDLPGTIEGPSRQPERDPVDAASSEITGAVVGSTLTTVIVFVPLALIAGVYGQFFASLSWALSIAVLVSMVISLTVVPVFAAKFLANRPMPEPGRFYTFMVERYEKLFEASLRFPWATLMISFAAMGVGVLLFTGIPNWFAQREPGEPAPAPLVKGLETGLMPAMDEGSFTVDYFAPTGTPLSQTEAMGRTLEDILLENPDVDVYVRRTGTQMGLFATKTNRGDIQTSLRPAEDDLWSVLTKPVRPELSQIEEELKRDGKAAIRRKYRRRPMSKVIAEIEDRIAEHFTQNQLKTELIQIMQDQLNDLSGQNKPLEVKLFGPDYSTLRPMANRVAETFETKGKGRGIRDVNSHVFDGNPDLMVQANGYWAQRGLTAMEVERQLRAMYLGQIATQVPESSLRITDVRVRYPDALRFGPGRFDPDLVLKQPILLPQGLVGPALAPGSVPLPGPARTVPLAAIANLQRLRTPDEQVRENQQPVVIVTAEQNEEEAGLGSVVADIREWMSEVPMPPGCHWELGGHYLQQQEAFRSLTVVMIMAVLLIYIMLAFQFRSVVLPLLIFLEQPLSLVSGLFALWITGTPLNVSSYMGAILLIGLDMKNGILLVEYIQQLLHQGMELRPALLEAGRVRFRPIIMTSLAAILGLLPLALGIGPGAQMQQPLAIMVMGGLIANMLFTRMVIRAGYLLLESRQVHA